VDSVSIPALYGTEAPKRPDRATKVPQEPIYETRARSKSGVFAPILLGWWDRSANLNRFSVHGIDWPRQNRRLNRG